MRSHRYILVVLASVALAGCNASSDTQRAAIGAAVGTAGSAVVGGNLLAGAAVGAAAGALCNDMALC
jgi:hypothetical protein